jgi:hypothetical protein
MCNEQNGLALRHGMRSLKTYSILYRANNFLVNVQLVIPCFKTNTMYTGYLIQYHLHYIQLKVLWFFKIHKY